MALKDDKIKDLFSSKLNSFEPEVPASVWGGIDQLLSQMPVTPTPDAASQSGAQAGSQAGNAATAVAKTGAVLKTTLITIGIAASVAAGVFLVYDPAEVEVPQIVEEMKPNELIEEPREEMLVDEKTKVLAQADFVKPRQRRVSDVSAVQEQEEVAAVTTPEVEEEEKVVEKSEVKETKEEQAEEIIPLPVQKFFKKDISFGVKTNAGALDRDVDNKGGDVLFSHSDRSVEFTDMLEDENKEYELSHRQPISVGLTLSKSLSPRFSIETGLMFTYLSSRVKSNSSVNIKEEQVFGYLGIPIYLNYNFLDVHRAKFYISLGAMMQKDIYGKYTSRLVGVQTIYDKDMQSEILYAEPSYLKKNISQSNWQFSTHLNVGVAYPIYRRIYIRTSIGGAYYFDAGNEYRTIYSDRKFQLDLNLGLRFDF